MIRVSGVSNVLRRVAAYEPRTAWQNAVYDALGVGIPHHVQSFFARLRDHARMQRQDQVTVEDVGEVYRTEVPRPFRAE